MRGYWYMQEKPEDERGSEHNKRVIEEVGLATAKEPKREQHYACCKINYRGGVKKLMGWLYWRKLSTS